MPSHSPVNRQPYSTLTSKFSAIYNCGVNRRVVRSYLSWRALLMHSRREKIGIWYDRAVPTVHREAGIRFSFFADDGGEPRHVHAIRGREKNGEIAKVWLDPVSQDYNLGFNASEIRKIMQIINREQDVLRRRWDEFFARA